MRWVLGALVVSVLVFYFDKVAEDEWALFLVSNLGEEGVEFVRRAQRADRRRRILRDFCRGKLLG